MSLDLVSLFLLVLLPLGSLYCQKPSLLMATPGLQPHFSKTRGRQFGFHQLFSDCSNQRLRISSDHLISMIGSGPISDHHDGYCDQGRRVILVGQVYVMSNQGWIFTLCPTQSTKNEVRVGVGDGDTP